MTMICCGPGPGGPPAYGRAILDQMTAGKGGRTGLTTGFTGDRGGIFLRFRAIMDTTPKRRGRLLLASASILILLAGGLVSCAPAAAESSGGALELSGADAGPGEMLPLEERFESYNRERGRSLPVSRGEWHERSATALPTRSRGWRCWSDSARGRGTPFLRRSCSRGGALASTCQSFRWPRAAQRGVPLCPWPT